MKRILLIVPAAMLVALVAGCDTALEGSYMPYKPETPAAEWWPQPDTAPQPAAYHETPTTQPTQPTTAPADRGA